MKTNGQRKLSEPFTLLCYWLCNIPHNPIKSLFIGGNISRCFENKVITERVNGTNRTRPQSIHFLKGYKGVEIM
jgi:hypothetical protein